MKDMEFGTWAEEWLAMKKNYVKESTYANYIFLFRNHILPDMGDFVIEQLDSDILQEQVLKWLREGNLRGGGLSQKTVKDMVALVKACLNSYMKKNGRSMAELEVMYPRKTENNRKAVMTKEQQNRFLNIIENDLTWESLGYAVSLYTGVRIGELCALKWSNIDMEERTIRINQTLQRIYLKESTKDSYTKLIITSPKSQKAVREIPIANTLYQLIRRFPYQREDTYLLTGTRKYIEPRLYRKHYEKFMKEKSFEYIRFHGLRHTFATRCIEAGADYKVVSELLGHASVNLTLNLYTHPQMEEKRRCVDLL